MSVLRVYFQQVRSHKALIRFFGLFGERFPSRKFAATLGGATHTAGREMIHGIVAHGIIKCQLLSCADVSESYKIVGTCFIYTDTAIGITGMIHFAD